MSQANIDAFVKSAGKGILTPEGVTTALAAGIPVNGRQSEYGWTALHLAVDMKRRELVAALLAAGADANVKSKYGETSVWWGAVITTADILQLLIDSGGSVNEPMNGGETPLTALVRWSEGEAAGLGVLLARPELDLDVTYEGKTAEQWAEEEGYSDYAAAIAEEVCLAGCFLFVVGFERCSFVLCLYSMVHSG
jgi:ankyrin repeat protein